MQKEPRGSLAVSSLSDSFVLDMLAFTSGRQNERHPDEFVQRQFLGLHHRYHHKIPGPMDRDRDSKSLLDGHAGILR